jgi:hypothetical protein
MQCIEPEKQRAYVDAEVIYKLCEEGQTVDCEMLDALVGYTTLLQHLPRELRLTLLQKSILTIHDPGTVLPVGTENINATI